MGALAPLEPPTPAEGSWSRRFAGRGFARLAAISCLLVLTVLAGCGDRCDRLCNLIELRLAECRTLPADWARTCRSDWRDSAASLTSREQDLALQVCADTRAAAAEWSCEDLAALYDTGDPP